MVRIWGISFNLPYIYHIDEARFSKITINYFSGDLNPHFFHVPSMHSYVIAGIWGSYFLIGKICGEFNSLTDFTNSFNKDSTLFFILGRLFSAILGVATVLVVYYLGKRMYNHRVGILASLLLIFSPVHNKISHYMVPDGPMVFFLIFSFLFIWLIYLKGETKYYILAGLMAGFGMATKYGGQLLFIPLLLAHLFHGLEKKQSLKEIIFTFKPILSGLFFILGFIIGCPYAILDFPTFWRDFNWQARHLYTAGHYGSSTAQPAWLFYLKYGFRENIGKFSQYLVFLGIVWGIIRLRKREIILLSLPLFLFFVMSNWKTMAVRYLLPVVPFLVLIGAYALDFSFTQLSSKFSFLKKKEVYIWSLIVIILLYPSILKVVRFNYSLTQKDTRTIAKEWIEQNIPKRKKIALEMYCPPISRRNYKIIYRHSLSQVGLEWLHKRKVEFIIVSDIMYNRFIRAPQEFPQQTKFYHSLEEKALLIKSFQPKWDEYLTDLHNPTIKIFRLSNYPNFSFPGNFNFYSQILSFRKLTPKEWSVKTKISVKDLLKGNEKVKNPYFRIINDKGEELSKFLVFEGEVNSSSFFSNSFKVRNLPLKGTLKIGYEYSFSPSPIFVKPQGNLEKERSLIEEIDQFISSQKKFKLIFLYFQFPNTRGDDYFQSITISKFGNQGQLTTKIFGGELTQGNDYVLNPWIKITDSKGKEIFKLIIFNGKVGSHEADKKAPLENSKDFSLLPEDFKIYIGYDYYFDLEYPDLAGGPEEIELPINY